MSVCETQTSEAEHKNKQNSQRTKTRIPETVQKNNGHWDFDKHNKYNNMFIIWEHGWTREPIGYLR